MTGNYVKNKLKASGFKLIDVANKMGVSPQNLEGKLKSNDIKVGILESIAKAINENLYFFFEEHQKGVKSVEEPRVPYGKIDKDCLICKEKERVIQQQQVLIKQQQKIINLLENKNK